MLSPDEAAALLRDEARRAGFARVGLAPVAPWARHDFYRRWLAAGHAGDMDYLHLQQDERRDPRTLLATARTLVSVAVSYATSDEPIAADRLARGRIARYARGADYHHVLKERLRQLAAAIAARLGRPVATRSCVDTAPLLEREAAHAGGLGFIAKNTLVIAPGLGSYHVLGELLVDVEATPGEPAEPRCGRSRACLDACPTGAFTDAYTLDARRCISHLTIESSGPIPRALRPLFEDMIFGCDRCQEVCPFNAGEALATGDPALAPLDHRQLPPLRELLRIGAAQFRKFVRRSAMRRIHRAQLLRNVAVALGNVGDDGDLPSLTLALDEPSPLVRAHVAWALGRVAARHPSSLPAAHAALAARRAVEEDPSVVEEIAFALALSGAPPPGSAAPAPPAPALPRR